MNSSDDQLVKDHGLGSSNGRSTVLKDKCAELPQGHIEPVCN